MDAASPAVLVKPILRGYRYKNANKGHEPEDVSLLMPYAATPEQKSTVEKLILRRAQQK